MKKCPDDRSELYGNIMMRTWMKLGRMQKKRNKK